MALRPTSLHLRVPRSLSFLAVRTDSLVDDVGAPFQDAFTRPFPGMFSSKALLSLLQVVSVTIVLTGSIAALIACALLSFKWFKDH